MKSLYYSALFFIVINSSFIHLLFAQNTTNILTDIINSIETDFSLEEELMIGTDKLHAQKIETLLHPEIEATLPFDIDFTAIGQFRYDAIDKIDHGTLSQSEISPASRRAVIGDRIDFELRELYFEKNINNVYLKLGKQQIVWGNSDGLKVLDVVNPQDFREFIHDEWEDSRIPLWTLNAEIPISEWLMQLLWIPDRTYHKLPEQNSSFSFTSPMIMPEPPTNVLVNLNSVERSKRFLADSDMGVRFSRFWNGWDLTFNYLYHHDDIPVPFSKVTIKRGKPLVTVSPEYKRTQLIGGTFSNAFGSLVVRGEAGYSFNKYFVVDDRNNRDGVVEADEFSYVLGFDWSGFSNTILSFQLFQGIVTHTPAGLIRDQVETRASIYMSRDFFNNVLHTELIWLQNLNRDDGFFRPRMSYELKDDVVLKLGYDLFYGTSKGIFGQFDTNDRFTLGFEMGF